LEVGIGEEMLMPEFEINVLERDAGVLVCGRDRLIPTDALTPIEALMCGPLRLRTLKVWMEIVGTVKLGTLIEGGGMLIEMPGMLKLGIETVGIVKLGTLKLGMLKLGMLRLGLPTEALVPTEPLIPTETLMWGTLEEAVGMLKVGIDTDGTLSEGTVREGILNDDTLIESDGTLTDGVGTLKEGALK
jgi:hypothetical protein